jgi:hypothetical protein
LQIAMHRQARQAETRHVVTSQSTPNDLRRLRIVNRSRAQAIEAENGLAIGIVHRKECFRATQIVALAGVALQKLVQRWFAAIEGFAIMLLGNRFFVPACHDLGRLRQRLGRSQQFCVRSRRVLQQIHHPKTVPL